MDQREWGRLRETVVWRTRATGASREDAEDAAHDALVAAIGAPQRPDSDVAWLSTVARRRQADRVRRRVREQRLAAVRPADLDPTTVGPEESVVERAHASWLAASLGELPSTTREVVDAVGSGMAPAEVARSMNLSPRSIESHLTRARRHLRRLGALGIPLGALLGWALRHQPGFRSAPVAVAFAVPVLVTAVALLPSSVPVDTAPETPPPAAAAPMMPVSPAPAPPEPMPAPPAVPPSIGAPDPRVALPAGPVARGDDAGRPDRATAEAGVEPGSGADGADGVSAPADGAPTGRSAPESACPGLLAQLGCAVGGLVDGVMEVLPPAAAPARGR
jgi:RNA polymerase sigma factor (sigma-70 family)